MKHIYTVLTAGLIIYRLILNQSLDTLAVALVLILSTLIIIKERFFDSTLLVYLLMIVCIVVSILKPSFAPLLGLAAFYGVYRRTYTAPILGIIAVFIMQQYYMDEIILFWTVCGGCFGYIVAYFIKKDIQALRSLDEERRLRHELESTKNKLLQSQDEIEFLTEVKERNRIAREIHDSVGHNIAGVLFHLQAASKLFDKKPDDSKKMIDESTKKLSETLELTRETVYNLASDITIGIAQIKELIDNYDYCPVDFDYKGNFNQLSPKYLALINNIIRESLTNASRHSHATHILISLEANDFFIRYSYQDNGVGGDINYSGLGLRTIKERIDNVNGTLVIDGTEGFKIVCNIPK